MFDFVAAETNEPPTFNASCVANTSAEYLSECKITPYKIPDVLRGKYKGTVGNERGSIEFGFSITVISKGMYFAIFCPQQNVEGIL